MNTPLKRTTAVVPVSTSDIPSPPSEDGSAGVAASFMKSDAVAKAHPCIIYRMNTDQANSDNPIGSTGGQWEIADDTENETQLGSTEVTEASGIFSFGSTGKWTAELNINTHNATGNETDLLIEIQSTDDNSTYTTIAEKRICTQAAFPYGSCSMKVLIEVENITLDKIKGKITCGHASTVVRGNTAQNETTFTFEKKADL